MSQGKLRLFISLVTISAVHGALAATSSSTAKQVTDYTRPLSFEPNRGQADSQVDFLAHGMAYDLSLSHAEAVITLERGARKAGLPMDTASVRMSPIGASGSLTAEPLDRQPSKSNYFLGNVPAKWHTNVANYAKVRYRDVYPGIDVIYYGNQRQLEYDFVVSPGSDPAHILLGFEGAASAALDRKGDLVVHTAAGDLRWQKPVAYQEVHGSRQLVACSYTRKRDGRLGFSIAAYDRTKPLIIDPILVYSTFLGGVFIGDVANSWASAIAVDSEGSAYVTGTTSSIYFPATAGAFQSGHRGAPNTHGTGLTYAANAFVTKFDAEGKLVYSTYLGGCGCLRDSGFVNPAGDAGNAIAVDAHGNAYIAGLTYSLDFPTQNAFESSVGIDNVSGQAFVTKLTADGSELIFSTYLGGARVGNVDAPFFGSAKGIAVGPDDASYVTGATTVTDFPTLNAFQSQLKGSENAFVAKFDAVGTLIYSTYLGGSGNDQGNAIATDADGNAYVAGSTSSTDFPIMNAFQRENKSCGTQAFSGCQNAFVTKLDAAGIALVYSTYLGGSGQRCEQCMGTGDSANGIAVDRHGNAYLVGTATSLDFPTKNAFQPKLKATCSGCGNAFVTKFDAEGCALLYSTYLGGSGTGGGSGKFLIPFIGTLGDVGMGIAVDARKQVYVTGQTHSANFPTKNAFQSKLGGGADAFVTKIDAAGRALVYSTHLGADDGGLGIAVDRAGDAYVTGVVDGSTYIGNLSGRPDALPNFPTKNAFQSTTADFNNAFVTKFSRRSCHREH